MNLASFFEASVLFESIMNGEPDKAKKAMWSHLQSKMVGYLIDMKIVPFRGEHFMLKGSKRQLVKNLIYPVPNRDFPFSGVHFTRMIDGQVDVGMNAVPGFKREAYNKLSFNLRDFSEMITYPGYWKRNC